MSRAHKSWIYLGLMALLFLMALGGCSKPAPESPAKMLGALPTQTMR